MPLTPAPPAPHGLSVDLEDLELSVREPLGLPLPARSEHLESQTTSLLRLFDEYGARATFFVNARSVESCPGLLARIAGAGHELAAHGYSHRFLPSYGSAAEFEQDLRECLRLIDRECGVRPVGYRAPGFTLRGREKEVLPVLRELGFEYDSSVLSVGLPHQHGYGRGPEHVFRWSNGILELPMTSWSLLGVRLPAFGSWSLRLLPLANTTLALRGLERRGRPGFLYLHPWEVTGQPVSRELARARFPLVRIWIARRGRTMERRLRALLQRHRFVPYRELAAAVAPLAVRPF
jgi:peptidoglycan/xylan/chitin deacetylase (PgdA/CDA1 family)